MATHLISTFGTKNNKISLGIFFDSNCKELNIFRLVRSTEYYRLSEDSVLKFVFFFESVQGKFSYTAASYCFDIRNLFFIRFFFLCFSFHRFVGPYQSVILSPCAPFTRYESHFNAIRIYFSKELESYGTMEYLTNVRCFLDKAASTVTQYSANRLYEQNIDIERNFPVKIHERIHISPMSI